ncbi:globin family protein [Leptolyngbya iicbica]|uniref:Flavohemoprotein n=2 Tax=Cyanophyceae TaxID=3028117 RepID=A0A4Q7EFE3_9CYAN|nr:globin family protein [Leptolyngbya sp. LK]RZM82005.1 flavohemoprotein [Leptolyngbya sp. LK]
MTDQIRLLEDSFAKVKPNAMAFSNCFHQHLFAKHPDIEPLFGDLSLELMEKKLVASLALIVENLHNPDALGHALQGLGAYHVTKGTMAEHYPYVGQALLEAFEDFLGSDWTPEVAQAWMGAYRTISDIMQQGAAHSEDLLDGELTFYEWLDLYGESSPTLRKLVESTTHFKYGTQE